MADEMREHAYIILLGLIGILGFLLNAILLPLAIWLGKRLARKIDDMEADHRTIETNFVRIETCRQAHQEMTSALRREWHACVEAIRTEWKIVANQITDQLSKGDSNFANIREEVGELRERVARLEAGHKE